MGRRASQYVVVTKKNDPGYVRMFDKLDEALDMTGPEYDKHGFVVNVFEKKTDTYFSAVEVEKPKDDKKDVPLFDQGNNGQLSE